MGMEDQMIPLPDVLPLAERVKTPAECPDGAKMVLCEMGVGLKVLPLN
jgi:hypothetical protein